MSLNENIELNLEKYLAKEKAEYAISISGTWGSGKSYFINKFIEKNRKNYKSIYVSLYGKATLKDIQDDIYAQFHPFLSHKYVKVGGNLVKGLLKGTLKIDLNRDGNDDGTLSYQIPDLNLKDQKIELKNTFLVFDDVERCDIDLIKVLGFINAFVEHDGIKTILIVNDEEIKDVNYFKVREKVVGRIFELQTDIEEVVDFFIGNSSVCFEFLSENKDLIIRYYKNNGMKNLRLISYTLQDFELFFDVIDSTYKDNKLFMQYIFEVYFFLSLEAKCGNLKKGEVKKLYIASMDRYLKEKDNKIVDEETLRLANVASKCNKISNKILIDETWENLIFSNLNDKYIINEEIGSCSFFFDINAPTWLKMMKMTYMTEEVLKNNLDKLIDDLCSAKEQNLDIILHYCGVLLAIDKYGISLSVTNLDMVHVYLNCYFDSRKKNLKDNYNLKQIFFSLSEPDHYGGFGFYCADLPEFRELFEKIKKFKLELIDDILNIESEQLLIFFEKNWSEFCRLLSENYQRDSFTYNKLSILDKVDNVSFVDKLLQKDIESIQEFRALIKSRYRYGFQDFNKEKLWLKNLSFQIESEIEKRVIDRVKAFNLRRIVELIDELVGTSAS